MFYLRKNFELANNLKNQQYGSSSVWKHNFYICI